MKSLQVVNPIDAHIGARIAMRRAALGLTREAIAQTLDVTVRQVCAFEKGEARAPSAALFELAALFDVSMAYFFEVDGFGPSGLSAPGG